MREIIRVKSDHGVLSVRIPKEYVRTHGITKKDCLIWVHNRKGELVLKTIKETVEDDKKHENDSD